MLFIIETCYKYLFGNVKKNKNKMLKTKIKRNRPPVESTMLLLAAPTGHLEDCSVSLLTSRELQCLFTASSGHPDCSVSLLPLMAILRRRSQTIIMFANRHCPVPEFQLLRNLELLDRLLYLDLYHHYY